MADTKPRQKHLLVGQLNRWSRYPQRPMLAAVLVHLILGGLGLVSQRVAQTTQMLKQEHAAYGQLEWEQQIGFS